MMFRHSLFGRLTSVFRSAPTVCRSARRRPAARRLTLEFLEHRDTPSFAAPVNYALGSTTVYAAVVTGDFNGDSRTDLAYHSINGPNTVGVLLGNGNGTFQPVQKYAAGYSIGPNSIAVGDFNTDGRSDLVTANENGTVSVLFGNGNGTFAAPQTLLIDDLSWALSVTVGDLNQDGNMDLAVGTWRAVGYPDDGAHLNVLLGNGDGTFASPTDYALLNDSTVDRAAYSVQLGDLNNDGKLDAVTANSDHTLGILLGNGDGTLQAPTLVNTGPGLTVWNMSVSVADLNADGNLDLAASDSNGLTVSVLLGNGNGTFATYQSYATGGNSTSVAVADFNQDGRPDLITANTDGHNVSVLLGNGDGTFQSMRNYPAGMSPWSIAVGSFNGDAFPDVAVTNAEASALSVLVNDGNWAPPAPPSIRISDVTRAEGQRGTTYFVFTVTLSGSYTAPVTVNFATANGTAKTSDKDYVATSGTLTFAPGETTKFIVVSISADRRKEGNETFFINLTGAVNAFIEDAQGIGTILNDD